MFKQLKPFKKIIVTGPQRTGTTIAAKMIANDLGLEYLREENMKSPYNFNKLVEFYDEKDSFVIQCPALFHKIPEFGRWEVAVVCMIRAFDDILKSQDRIGWTIRNEPSEVELHHEYYKPVSEAKYVLWEKWKVEGLIVHPFEIEFESLSKHPMWIAKEQRIWFHPRQTTADRSDIP